MDENTVHKPLLLSPNTEPGYIREASFSVSLVKLMLRIVMWVIFILWVAITFLLPAEFFSKLVRKSYQATSGTVFGMTGSLFLLFSAPILAISFLSVAYLLIRGEEEFAKKKTSRFPSFRLWTFPVIVDGPFGVVSAAEFIGIVLFGLYVIWAVYAYTLQTLHLVAEVDLSSFKEQSCLFLEIMGLRLGSIGIFCLAFLFLPVARGSVLLRLIDIPFEHATRYHVWLGHLTMVLFTLHGLLYVIGWTIEGRLSEKMNIRTNCDHCRKFCPLSLWLVMRRGIFSGIPEFPELGGGGV